MKIPPAILDGVKRLVAFPRQGIIDWTVVLNDHVLHSGTCDLYDEIAETQAEYGIEHVIIDDSINPQEVQEAAYQWGWKTFRTPSSLAVLKKEIQPVSGARNLIARLDTLVDGVAETKLIWLFGLEICGHVALEFHNRRAACIRQLFVPVKFRGNDIGTALVKEAGKIARKAGCQSLGLTVTKRNVAVLPFYEKLGFVLAYEFEDGDALLSLVL